MPNLPLELVSEILHVILETDEEHTGNAQANTKPPWSFVSSLSLTCKLYRDLVLRAWFYRFYTENFRDTAELTEHIPQAKKSWVKQLHCLNPTSSSFHQRSSWDLDGYDHLELVRLDWLSKWNPSAGDLRETSDYLPFVNTPHTVTTFDLRNLRWPLPTAYLFIHQCFPFIRKLALHQQKIWCMLCFAVNRIGFVAPIPRRLIYEGGLGLPMHYAKALKSLQFLECITINTVASHFGATSVSQAQNEYLWTGECDSCMGLVSTHPQFMRAYISGKKRGVVQINDTEHEVPHPPRLRCVEWIFTPVPVRNNVTLDSQGDMLDMDTGSESEEVDEDEEEGDS